MYVAPAMAPATVVRVIVLPSQIAVKAANVGVAGTAVTVTFCVKVALHTPLATVKERVCAPVAAA